MIMLSGSLAPSFVNNDYVTAEIIYSTAHVCHEFFLTAEITYSIRQVHHKVLLAWRIPWTEDPGGYSPWGLKELDTT